MLAKATDFQDNVHYNYFLVTWASRGPHVGLTLIPQIWTWVKAENIY